MDKTLVTRVLPCKLEIRDTGNGERHIIGLIPYNQLSVDIGFGYFEVITPTAFNKTLADGADVKALVSHDTSKILGRVANRMLVLTNTPAGLQCDLTVGNQSYALDLYESVKRQDVTTMSFGFFIDQEDVTYDDTAGTETHYLKSVALVEVSFGVVFPAYPATESEARSRSLRRGQNAEPVGVIDSIFDELLETSAVHTMAPATATAANTNTLENVLEGMF